MHITRDKLWKSIIEDFWPDFLRYFFPDIEHLIDFERDAIFLDKDLDQLFPDRAEGDRRVDILMQVWFLDGSDHWFLVHAEIQGYDDEDFAQRMYRYHTRILDKHHRHLTSIAVFLNKNATFQPSAYQYAFAGTELTLRYRTFVVNDHPYEALYQPGNPFGLVMQTAWVAIKGNRMRRNQFDQWLYQQKGNLHRRMLEDGYSSKHSRRFLWFLDLYLIFRNKDVDKQFKAEILHFDPNRKPMGIIELVTEEATRIVRRNAERAGKRAGRQEGRQEGRREGRQEGALAKTLAVIQQLVLDTDFDDARIVRISGGTLEQVSLIRSRVGAGNLALDDLLPD